MVEAIDQEMHDAEHDKQQVEEENKNFMTLEQEIRLVN